MAYHIQSIKSIRPYNNINTKATCAGYPNTDSTTILTWNITTPPTTDRQIITNFTNIVPSPYYHFDTDPSQNGFIIIDVAGKYDISLCYNDEYADNIYCDGVDPNLFIYWGKNTGADAHSIQDNASTYCMNIPLGCLHVCATQKNYKLDVGNTLHFKISNGQPKGSTYYAGFVNLSLH
jgi:hypothetical protein